MLTNVLLALNLLALLAFGAGLYVLHLRATAVAQAAAALAASAGAHPADLGAAARAAGIEAQQFYTIEVLNPLEVAAAESKLGAVFQSLAPEIVKREMHRQALVIISDQLAARGIKADVKLHG